jgi:hypothetical protein
MVCARRPSGFPAVQMTVRNLAAPKAEARVKETETLRLRFRLRCGVFMHGVRSGFWSVRKTKKLANPTLTFTPPLRRRQNDVPRGTFWRWARGWSTEFRVRSIEYGVHRGRSVRRALSADVAVEVGFGGIFGARIVDELRFLRGGIPPKGGTPTKKSNPAAKDRGVCCLRNPVQEKFRRRP